jgi:DNA/RNA endonuclease G (NUC1)
MSIHNAPSWAALESAVLDWAHEVGRVWLIVGPVYHERDRPQFAKKRSTGKNLILPVPDALYYVVIGERNGRMAAVGFLVPHAEPKAFDYRAHACSVDEIEAATGLNFMPSRPCSRPRLQVVPFPSTPRCAS